VDSGAIISGIHWFLRRSFFCPLPHSPSPPTSIAYSTICYSLHATGSRLDHLAEEFWTVNEVINEIRDSRSRAVLASLPFELKTRVPSEEAIQFGE
jgi:hypothetical protein